MTHNKTFPRALRPVAAALLAAFAGAAAAQEDPAPWYIGAQQSFSHDSNVFRSATNEISDTISSTALLAGVNLPFGRQRITADGLVRHDAYKDQDQLDHTGYRLGARLDWATIERLSGSLDLSSRQELTRDDLLTPGDNTVKTLQRVNNATFTGRIGATSVLAIQGRLGYQDVSYDSDLQALFDPIEYNQTIASLGVLWRPSGLITLGLAGRFTKGEYENIGDEYDRKDIDLTAVWEPTGISRVSARLSATDEEHDLQTQRDVSGVTGALQWTWRPTGKMRFVSDLVRETGSQIAFAQVQLPTGELLTATAPDSRVVTSVGVQAFYELTAKIALNATLRHAEREFRFGQIPDDRTSLVSIGARWDPTRSIGVGCSLSHQTRGSSDPNREFDANLASCFARFTLQG
jgi:hypothetical protein